MANLYRTLTTEDEFYYVRANDFNEASAKTSAYLKQQRGEKLPTVNVVTLIAFNYSEALTPSEKVMAKKLGMTEEQYRKSVGLTVNEDYSVFIDELITDEELNDVDRELHGKEVIK